MSSPQYRLESGNPPLRNTIGALLYYNDDDSEAATQRTRLSTSSTQTSLLGGHLLQHIDTKTSSSYLATKGSKATCVSGSGTDIRAGVSTNTQPSDVKNA